MDLSWITETLGRPSLGWRDVIDIALVSLLIYEVLVLIRGTRAVQMAVGAGLAVALFYLSNILQLETVNWLIRNMVGYVVFAAIVLFQSDIRRALAHLGRAPFFRYLAKGETVDETVEEIAVAAQMLSSQRTGARDRARRAAASWLLSRCSRSARAAHAARCPVHSHRRWCRPQ